MCGFVIQLSFWGHLENIEKVNSYIHILKYKAYTESNVQPNNQIINKKDQHWRHFDIVWLPLVMPNHKYKNHRKIN